jgi:hypothetical protein
MSVSRGQIFFCIIERETRQDVVQHQGLARAWMQAEHRSGEGLCCLRMKKEGERSVEEGC